MAGHDIIVIAASAGGVEALVALVGDLPMDLPAAVMVVLHVAPDTPSLLPTILRRAGRLPAAHPQDRDRVRPGRIYCAPPDHHLLLADGGLIHLSRGPRENSHRPAADALFRSAAIHYGPRVVGVVLSGNLADGTAGLVGSNAGVASPSRKTPPRPPSRACPSAPSKRPTSTTSSTSATWPPRWSA